MEAEQLAALAAERKWLAMSFVLIGLLIRLLKLPIVPAPLDRIPSKARPAVAMLLGVLSGVMQHVLQGAAWGPAIEQGLFAAALAIATHDVGIEWLRGGRELLAPSPSPDELPPTLRDGDRRGP